MPETPENEEWFWNLIESGERSPAQFQLKLRELERDELIAFRSAFLMKSLDLITEQFEDLLGEYSEDGREEIAEWVVSQGREYYEHVSSDPATHLPAECFELDDSFTANSFTGCVEHVFFERHGESITNYE